MTKTVIAMTKACTKCKTEKPRQEFVKLRRSRDGLHSQCKACISVRRRAYLAANPAAREKARANCRQWHRDNFQVSRARANAHYHNNKDHHRSTRMMRKYGITIEVYDRMLSLQGGKCAICGRSTPTRGDGMLQVDHDHKTGEVRGLLCSPCNTVLGYIRDNPDALRAAVAYLEDPPARQTGSD